MKHILSQGRSIASKWIFTKESADGDIRYKARLVAKGYAQREGIDYNEIFSSLVKHSSIRILHGFGGTIQLESGATRCEDNFSSQVSRRRNLCLSLRDSENLVNKVSCAD